MSDDIVTRLRDLREILMSNPIMAREVQEAMDEIERLRAERDRWAQWGEHVLVCPNKGKHPCRHCISPAIIADL